MTGVSIVGRVQASEREIIAARENYQSEDVQVDDDAECSVCVEGVWVSAWVFISKRELDNWKS